MSILAEINTQTEAAEGGDDEQEPPLRNPGRFVRLKCTIAEVIWVQRMIGRPVSPIDWAMFLHPRKEPKTRERSWERFKAALVRWGIPHERIIQHCANVIAGKGATRQVLIRLKLRPEDIDSFFWDRWCVPMPGCESPDVERARKQKLARPDKGEEPGRASKGKDTISDEDNTA